MRYQDDDLGSFDPVAVAACLARYVSEFRSQVTGGGGWPARFRFTPPTTPLERAAFARFLAEAERDLGVRLPGVR
jgi:hypothetical protein